VIALDEQIVALDCLLQIEAERRYYVERCLRLELKIARLEGHPGERLKALVPPVRQRPWRATDADKAKMRDLRRRGMEYKQIGQRTGFSYTTARLYTRDVLFEREVGR
jgi:hypothetical protein